MLHPSQARARVRVCSPGWCGLLLLAAVLLLFGVLVGTSALEAAAAQTSQCVACHTDAAKLKALTPPDPPSEEEGEG
jgi:hypothetical protein